MPLCKKTSYKPRLLPSLTMGLTLGPLQVLVTNPLSKLSAKLINNIGNSSLNSWPEKFKVGLTNPFKGTTAGIISALVSKEKIQGIHR